MRRTWPVALLIWLAAFALYWGTARLFDQAMTPPFAYFNHLADAFLHGRLHLVDPPATADLTLYQGRWYVPFPPLPALLMMPWVATMGVDSLNTVLFCALFGALNVTLIFLILASLTQQGWTQLSTGDTLWLTLLFGAGSVHWYMATIGSVWFVAQICTLTFVALSVWLAIMRRSPWLVGLALAMAIATRPPVLLTWPLIFAIAVTHQETAESATRWRTLVRWSLQTSVPLALAIGALLLYNLARFDNLFDFGYLTANVADVLRPNLQRYGQFHLYYVPKNVWAMLLAGPQWDPALNFWRPDREGMSLLLTTPALIYLGRARQRSWLVIGGWLAIALLLIPLLCYYNTGWWQFGYRFSLDFMTPVMVLLALAVRSRVSPAMRLLIGAGVVANLYGVCWWHL